MAKFGKWIGAGLGWVIGGGPIGGLIGLFIGSLFDSSVVEVGASGTHTIGKRGQTTQGDFVISLLVLSAAVMKSDGKTMMSELNYVKEFLKKQFGNEAAAEQLKILNEILKKDIPLAEVCMQIRQHVPLSGRLQMLHYLYGISKADGEIHPSELETIQLIASYLHISQADSISIMAMYYRDTTSDYKILEIAESATDEEVKKAYRKMAMKFHPDKVSGMGEAIQKSAEEKFRMVQEAYEAIKKKRNMS